MARGKWIKEGTEDGGWMWTYEEFWDGFSTKHYRDEHIRHQKFYDHQYEDNKEAEKIIKKLRRHFKLNFSYEFRLRSWGRAYRSFFGGKSIDFPKSGTSLGLICHEVAHIVCYTKYQGKSVGHTKKFQRQSDRVCRWAERYLPNKEKGADNGEANEEVQGDS